MENSDLYEKYRKVAENTSPTSGLSRLEKYVVAKALTADIKNEEEFGKLILELEKTKAYKHFLKN